MKKIERDPVGSTARYEVMIDEAVYWVIQYRTAMVASQYESVYNQKQVNNYVHIHIPNSFNVKFCQPSVEKVCPFFHCRLSWCEGS